MTDSHRTLRNSKKIVKGHQFKIVIGKIKHFASIMHYTQILLVF